MKKITWLVKRIGSGKKLGVIQSDPNSDSVEESAVRIFGYGIFLELKDAKSPKFFHIVDGIPHETYVCKHHDDGTVSYPPNVVRPWPEEEFGGVVYEF